jgi:hypothetical protein
MWTGAVTSIVLILLDSLMLLIANTPLVSADNIVLRPIFFLSFVVPEFFYSSFLLNFSPQPPAPDSKVFWGANTFIIIFGSSVILVSKVEGSSGP